MIMGRHHIYLIKENKVEILKSQLVVKHEGVGMLELKYYYVVVLDVFVQLNGVILLTFLVLPNGELRKTLELIFIPLL
jgi:hypothetical protein